jgi:hypothetical protein
MGDVAGGRVVFYLVSGPPLSEQFESDRDAEGVSEASEVAFVAGHHQIPAGSRADHHRRIHHISYSTGRTGRASPSLIEVLDTTAGQQARHLRLRATSPTLTQHTGRHGRHDAALERAALQREYTTMPRSAAISAPAS